MKELFLALQFLTIIPVKVNPFGAAQKLPRTDDENKLAASMIFFPLVGCLIGLILAGIQSLSSFLGFKAIPAAIIVIIAMTILTGGIHLDGLADTSDAFLSHKNKEDLLRIMRDPHIGTMGVLSVISALLLKIALLSSINPSLKISALLLMCALSRWSLICALYFFPYARREGKARAFKEKINPKIYLLATLITLAIAKGLWKSPGLLTFATVGLSAYALGRFFKKHIGGITGDTLGAINEISEIIVLLCFCILGK